MASWANTLNCLDISYAVSSLNRFNVHLRVSHLNLAVHLFGYLKRNLNRRILMDSRPLQMDPELLKDS